MKSLSVWILPVLSLLLALGLSCSKDEDDAPDYEGTWDYVLPSYTATDTIDSVVITAVVTDRYVYEFREDSYSYYVETTNDLVDEWTVLLAEHGTLTLSGDNHVLKPTKVELLQPDPISQTFKLISYTEDEENFNLVLLNLNTPQLYQYTYVIDSQGDIILNFDYNMDGVSDQSQIFEAR